MDIYVVNIIRQVLLIYAGNFFFDDFYNKTGPPAKNTIYSVAYEYVMCVHLVISDHCKLCFQM